MFHCDACVWSLCEWLWTQWVAAHIRVLCSASFFAADLKKGCPSIKLEPKELEKGVLLRCTSFTSLLQLGFLFCFRPRRLIAPLVTLNSKVLRRPAWHHHSLVNLIQWTFTKLDHAFSKLQWQILVLLQMHCRLQTQQELIFITTHGWASSISSAGSSPRPIKKGTPKNKLHYFWDGKKSHDAKFLMTFKQLLLLL